MLPSTFRPHPSEVASSLLCRVQEAVHSVGGPAARVHGGRGQPSTATISTAPTLSLTQQAPSLMHVYCSSILMYVDVLQAQLNACVLFKYVGVCSSVRCSVYELFMYADVLDA